MDLEPGTKAYGLYDPMSKGVYVGGDVVFGEGKFWEWNKDQE